MSFGFLFQLSIYFIMDPYYHSISLFPVSVLDGLEKQLYFNILGSSSVHWKNIRKYVLLRSGQNNLGIELE